MKEESEKAGLKLNIQNTKIMASGPINSRQIGGETMETVTDFIFLGSKITADGDCSHEIKRCLLLGRKAITNLDSILKSKDITLSTKIHIVKSMVSPVPQMKSINSSALSFLYGPTLTSIHDYWKKTASIFVGKVMSLPFNMLSRLVITFLPRSKCLLISWLQSTSAVILEPKKIKSVTVYIVSPPICRELMGPDAMILVF